MNPFPTKHDELIQAALDGELTAEQQVEFGQLLERNADVREHYESLRRLAHMVDEVGLVAAPPDLAAATARAISLRRSVGVRSVSTLQGESAMARKAMIGLAAAAAVVLVTFAITGYPPIGKGTEGTIGQANRYQAAQPQLTASDVKLGDTAVQEFMQSDVFDKLMKDENARKLLSDEAVRKALADPAMSQAMRDESLRRALGDDALRSCCRTKP